MIAAPWSFETHELSTGYSSIVYDANGGALADYLDEPTARLIAAAPELYEACEFVREWLVSPFTPEELDDPNYNATFRKAGKAVLAALAKARGQS
jgi:hypothetical protein